MVEQEENKREEHLHYLKVLQEHYTTFQPEVRFAIDFAIKSLVGKGDVYIKNRKKLLSKLRTLLITRETVNKEISRLRKELNVLDNMIM